MSEPAAAAREMTLEEALAEGVAEIQAQRNPYESQVVQAIAAQEAGAPEPPAPAPDAGG